MKECCGKCKHCWKDSQDWLCHCEESEYAGIYTEYGHYCDCFEEK